jgi:hypothetical protein
VNAKHDEVDDAEVASMIEARAQQRAAAQQEADENRARAYASETAAPRRWWRFGVESRESEDATTLVIRCYRRQLQFDEHSPFSPLLFEPFNALCAALAALPAVVVCYVNLAWPYLIPAALGFVLTLFALGLTRPLHVRISPHNFLIYERHPRRPVAIGPRSQLRMDVTRWGADKLEIRGQWIEDEGPKWVQRRTFSLIHVLPRDARVVEALIAKYQLRGL